MKKIALLCIVLVLLASACAQATGVEIAMKVDGNLWRSLDAREKAILVSGIVDGLIVAAFFEVGSHGPEVAQDVWSRVAIDRTVAQIVRRLDDFYASRENRESNVGVVLAIRECLGGEQMARAMLNLREDEW